MVDFNYRYRTMYFIFDKERIQYNGAFVSNVIRRDIGNYMAYHGNYEILGKLTEMR